jgi:hypothetical protein
VLADRCDGLVYSQKDVIIVVSVFRETGFLAISEGYRMTSASDPCQDKYSSDTNIRGGGSQRQRRK